MLATGLPLLRVTLHSGTLHPQFLGTTFIWWRTSGQSEQTLIAHEITDLIQYEDNPVQRVCIGGETLRRRLDVSDNTLDFAVLKELKAQGGTEYLALPIRSAHGRNHYYMITYVTDRPGGFTVNEIEGDMTLVSQRIAVVCDIQERAVDCHQLLNAYLGPKTGPRVLAGQIRRGTGEELTVVLWSSDLRGFTERSVDRLPGDRMIAILNALFDAQATAIHDHGGEILKFIGDGLLAIFPIEEGATAGRAATNALEAAQEALAAVRRLNGEPSMADEPPLEIVVALHVGTVVYGNIGAAERTGFHRHWARSKSGQSARGNSEDPQHSNRAERRLCARLWETTHLARLSSAAWACQTTRAVRAGDRHSAGTSFLIKGPRTSTV